MATPKARAGGADGPRQTPPAQSLPSGLSAALAEFSRHLDAERALSRHTVRAYHGDIASLFEYASRYGVAEPAALDVTTLRGWLASQHQAGAARATVARRGAAARAFTRSRTAGGGSRRTPGRSLARRRRVAFCRRCCAGKR